MTMLGFLVVIVLIWAIVDISAFWEDKIWWVDKTPRKAVRIETVVGDEIDNPNASSAGRH